MPAYNKSKSCPDCGSRCEYNAKRCPQCGTGFVLLSPLEVRRGAHPAIPAFLIGVSAISLIAALIYMGLAERRSHTFDRGRVGPALSVTMPKVMVGNFRN